MKTISSGWKMFTAGFEGRIQLRWPMLLVAAWLTGCASMIDAGEDLQDTGFVAANMDWRAGRLERLTAPYGYLSLTGFELLEPGATTLGSAPDNDIRMDRGPARWGVLHLDAGGGEVRFDNAAPKQVLIDGEHRSEVWMDPEQPTTLQVDGIHAHLVTPGGRPALRVRDPRSPTRAQFVGLDYFDLDRSWRIEGEFLANPPGATLPIANVLGQLIDEPNPGRVRFERQGQTFELDAVAASDGRLFFILADRTSGRETYGLGRFLYADPPDPHGRVLIDLNQAYNPPCAFSAYTTCPLPPPQNRLDVHIRAGERKYSGKPGIEKPALPRT
ncbi:MAG: DUF1684 domain-containing protein [Wenzhouxiangellaceae bacterium]|nr:DUF1684 domain-containing protein [Wenzhouxiangellaceae bacterium]